MMKRYLYTHHNLCMLIFSIFYWILLLSCRVVYAGPFDFDSWPKDDPDLIYYEIIREPDGKVRIIDLRADVYPTPPSLIPTSPTLSEVPLPESYADVLKSMEAQNKINSKDPKYISCLPEAPLPESYADVLTSMEAQNALNEQNPKFVSFSEGSAAGSDTGSDAGSDSPSEGIPLPTSLDKIITVENLVVGYYDLTGELDCAPEVFVAKSIDFMEAQKLLIWGNRETVDIFMGQLITVVKNTQLGHDLRLSTAHLAATVTTVHVKSYMLARHDTVPPLDTMTNVFGTALANILAASPDLAQ